MASSLMVPPMREPNAVMLGEHAAATLRYIRASMEGAGTVAVSGLAGVTTGAVGSLAAVVASTTAMRPHWLAVWLIAAFVASLAGGAHGSPGFTTGIHSLRRHRFAVPLGLGPDCLPARR